MTEVEQIGQYALMAAIILESAIFGGNLFDILVNEKNLTRGFPDSLEHIRKYWVYRNPGHFFKVLNPPLALAAGLALLVFWHEAYGRRTLIGLAVLAYLITQAITVLYFFPQNRLIREGSVAEVRTVLERQGATRSALDLVRNVLTLLSCFLNLLALTQPLPA